MLVHLVLDATGEDEAITAAAEGRVVRVRVGAGEVVVLLGNHGGRVHGSASTDTGAVTGHPGTSHAVVHARLVGDGAATVVVQAVAIVVVVVHVLAGSHTCSSTEASADHALVVAIVVAIVVTGGVSIVASEALMVLVDHGVVDASIRGRSTVVRLVVMVLDAGEAVVVVVVEAVVHGVGVRLVANDASMVGVDRVVGRAD